MKNNTNKPRIDWNEYPDKPEIDEYSVRIELPKLKVTFVDRIRWAIKDMFKRKHPTIDSFEKACKDYNKKVGIK